MTNESYIFQGKFNPMRLLPGFIIAVIGIGLLVAIVNNPPPTAPIQAAYAGGGGILLAGLIMLFFVFKLYKPLKVDEESIYYGDKVIPISSIDKLQLSAQLNSWLTATSEGVIMKLKTGKDITINISNYINGRTFRETGERIKQQIERGIYKLDANEPEPEVKPDNIDMSDLQNEKFTKFFANLFVLPDFWLPGIGVMVVLVFINWRGHKSIMDFYALLLLFAAIQAIVFLTMPNYFLVSDNYLVIKKRLFFWKPTVIPMKDIKRISVFSTRRGGSGIEVLDSAYRLHVFRAGITLSNKLDDLIKIVEAHATLEE